MAHFVPRVGIFYIHLRLVPRPVWGFILLRLAPLCVFYFGRSHRIDLLLDTFISFRRSLFRYFHIFSSTSKEFLKHANIFRYLNYLMNLFRAYSDRHSNEKGPSYEKFESSENVANTCTLLLNYGR